MSILRRRSSFLKKAENPGGVCAEKAMAPVSQGFHFVGPEERRDLPKVAHVLRLGILQVLVVQELFNSHVSRRQGFRRSPAERALKGDVPCVRFSQHSFLQT